MKTKMNINNMKKLILTAFAALVISTVSFTQSKSEVSGNKGLSSLVTLESFMNSTENSLKYIAPAISEDNDVTVAIDRLEMLASISEESIKYVAPAVDEADEITTELEQLELMAAGTEASLKYEAPASLINNENEYFRGVTLKMMANKIK